MGNNVGRESTRFGEFAGESIPIKDVKLENGCRNSTFYCRKIDTTYDAIYDKNNKEHSINDEPSLTIICDLKGIEFTSCEWHNHGLLHRVGKPAKITVDINNKTITNEYFINGIYQYKETKKIKPTRSTHSRNSPRSSRRNYSSSYDDSYDYSY
jgi:hypothetical protein